MICDIRIKNSETYIINENSFIIMASSIALTIDNITDLGEVLKLIKIFKGTHMICIISKDLVES